MPPSNPNMPDHTPMFDPTRTAVVAHTIDELRAALTVIKGHTQLLGRAVRSNATPNTAELARRMENIERGVAPATRCLHKLEKHAR